MGSGGAPLNGLKTDNMSFKTATSLAYCVYRYGGSDTQVNKLYAKTDTQVNKIYAKTDTQINKIYAKNKIEQR